MDRISGLPPPATARPARPAATAVPFRPVRAEGAAATTADLAVTAPPPRDPGARDRRAAARARAILADLSLLQSGILAGATDTVVLRRLADSAPTPADDPRLADLLAHASLRAQVELARREVP